MLARAAAMTMPRPAAAGMVHRALAAAAGLVEMALLAASGAARLAADQGVRAQQEASAG